MQIDRRDNITNVNGRLKKIQNTIKSDAIDVLILEVNSDKSLDIKIDDKMEHFSNYNDYLNMYIYPNQKKSVSIIVDDINLCN